MLVRLKTGVRALLALLAITAPLAAQSTQQPLPGRAAQSEAYDYSEPEKQFRLVIPTGLKTVRGIRVVSNYFGGDSRDYYTQNWYREFMNLHGFAFLGAKGDPSHAESYQAFLRALKRFGSESHHPELVNAPYATIGLSAGGGFASTLLTRNPDRVIAAGIICARYNPDAFDPHKYRFPPGRSS